MDKIRCGIIGATGYAGAEIVRLLISHPLAEIAAVSSVSYEGMKLSEIWPALSGLCDLHQRYGEAFKNSSAGKALLGEDGKFGKDDADRILKPVKEAAESVKQTLKDTFGKEN